MPLTEQDFIRLVRDTMQEVVRNLVKEEINRRIPPGTRFYRVIDDTGEVVGYHPMTDPHLKSMDQR